MKNNLRLNKRNLFLFIIMCGLIFAPDCFCMTIDEVTTKHLNEVTNFIQGPITKVILILTSALGLYYSAKNHNLLVLGVSVGAVLFASYFNDFVAKKFSVTIDMVPALIHQTPLTLNHSGSYKAFPDRSNN